MNGRYLELTTDAGHIVILSVKHIQSIKQYRTEYNGAKREGTDITMRDGHSYYVTETIDQVKQQLYSPTYLME